MERTGGLEMFRELTIYIVALFSGAAYAESTLSFGEWNINAKGTGTAEIMWSSSETIVGFQFDVVGVTLTSVDGGLSEKLNWLVSSNDFRVLGVALSADSYIPPQPKPAHLITLHFINAENVISFSEVIFVDNFNQVIKVDASDEIIAYPDCPSDLNGDATVDVVDLLEVVGSWGESNVPADINGDGIVDVSDLLAVVDSWGPC
jgi:hypothetical protein